MSTTPKSSNLIHFLEPFRTGPQALIETQNDETKLNVLGGITPQDLNSTLESEGLLKGSSQEARSNSFRLSNVSNDFLGDFLSKQNSDPIISEREESNLTVNGQNGQKHAQSNLNEKEARTHQLVCVEDDEQTLYALGKLSSRNMRENPLKTLKEPSFRFDHIFPVFDPEGASTDMFTFLNGNRTVVHLSNFRFSTAIGRGPLPFRGKYKFSVQVEYCNKKHPKLYVGVVCSNMKAKGLCYKPGWNFISAFSPYACLNGLRFANEKALAKTGQVISILIDADKKLVRYEIDGNEVIEGKINAAGSKFYELYPCVCIGEYGGRVSFV